MNEKKIIHIFFVLQIAIFVSGYFLVDLPRIIKIITMFLELFYLIKYKNNKKLISYLYVLIFSFLIYASFLTDKTDMTSLVYMPFTMLFLWYYMKDKDFKKINIVNIFKIVSIFISLFSVFKLIPSSYSYLLVLAVPLFIKNFEKDTNIFDMSSCFLTILGLFSFQNRFLNTICIIYLIIILIWGFKNLKDNSSKVGIIIPEIMLIFTVLFINFYPPYIHNIDSEFFEGEHFIIKTFKLLIPIIPFVFVIIKKGKKVFENYTNIDINYFSYIYILLSIIILIFYTRLDVNDFTFIMICLIAITCLKYIDEICYKLQDREVTIFALHLGYGGIEKYLSSLCKMLKEKYKVKIVSTYKVVDNPIYDFKDIEIEYLMDYGPNKEKFSECLKNKNLKGIIKEGFISLEILYNKRFLNIEKMQNVKSKYIITTRDFHNYIMGCYAKTGIIKIATEHNYHNNNQKYINTLLRSVKDLNYFVLVSPELKKFYEKHTKTKCIYIPNVLEKLPLKQSKCNTQNIISVGRLTKCKAQKDLIDVLYEVKKQIKDVKLYLIGDGEEMENLKSYAKGKKLSENILFTGFLNEDEIKKKMLDSSVFVTTSFTESFGLSVLDAMSNKLPVVAFDSASGVKFLLESECGILIKNRDKLKMKEEIVKLLIDKKYSKEVREKGYEKSKLFLMENISTKWFELLR